MKTFQLYDYFISCDQSICTDTRKIIPGSIFFALKGANFNGNTFVKSALEQGAKYAVVDEASAVLDDRCFLVKDVLRSLQSLARYHRKKFDIPVIGITGSNGKTTTKELIAAVLQKKYRALVTEGNLNNHLGVPFTLLRLRPEHEIAVIEMGANKPGDIEELCDLALPNYGIITNIGKAHLEGFGSYEGVIQTKTELYDALEFAEGLAFMNADDIVLLKNAPSINLLTYGSKGQVKSELMGLSPFLNFRWSAGDYHSPTLETHMVGSYNLPNYAAAAAIGYYFEVEPEAISEALAAYEPNNNRSQITKIGSNTLIVDCYNANPTSMMKALENFKDLKAENKIAILGDMKELGAISPEEHQTVVDWITEHKISSILVGSEFEKTRHTQEHFTTVQDLVSHLKNKGGFTNVFALLKGSRSIQLEKLIEENCFQ